MHKSDQYGYRKKNHASVSFNVFIFPKPPPQSRCNSKSIFRESKASLNSEFSFSKTGCLTITKEHSVPYYISIAWREQIYSGLFQEY